MLMDRDINPSTSNGENLKTRIFLQQLWQRFLAPSPRIVEPDQRRQAALLSAFLLVIIAIAGLLEVITVTLSERGDYTGYRTTIVVIFLLALIYGLSRTRYFSVAALLTVIVASLGTFAAGWNSPAGVEGGLMDYLIISIWLGSLYMTLNGLRIFILANLAGLLLFPSLAPGISLDTILIGPFSFVLALSLLLLVITRHRDLLERDRRAELTEKELRSRRAAARTQALLRVAGRLNAQLDLETLLAALCEEVAQALNTPVSLVTLYDQKQDILLATAGTGITPDQVKDILPLPKDAYDGTVKTLGKYYAVPDLQAMSNLPYANELKKLNLRSMAFATMEYEHELIGGLAAASRWEDRRTFTEDELLLLRGLADQAASAIVNTRLYKDSRRRLEHLQALRAIDIAIATNRDLRGMLDVLLDKITEQLKVDAAVVLLLDETSQHLEYAASKGFNSPTFRFTRLRLGEGIAGRAAQQRSIIRIKDLSTDPQTLTFAPSLAREGFASYFAAPLITQGQVKGVLEIFHRSVLDPDSEWLYFLETLAGQAAIAIESTSLFTDLQKTNDELSQAYDSTIEGWSHALDLRDKETEGHAKRVTEMTVRLAQNFGFSEAELVQVRRGSLLHDIGKMGVPDQILLKEGPLTDDEWIIMRQHPVFAHEMLQPIDYLRLALDIPYCHHEKWDGTGYPRGLKGEQIPLVARLFAVVDVWDAVTSDRPYRRGWERDKALAHIQEQKGLHFDPYVVERFIELMEIK
jgi:HD-GYP domain-containing protein (c-di-GMP phosphodiesterase class II)